MRHLIYRENGSFNVVKDRKVVRTFESLDEAMEYTEVSNKNIPMKRGAKPGGYWDVGCSKFKKRWSHLMDVEAHVDGFDLPEGKDPLMGRL